MLARYFDQLRFGQLTGLSVPIFITVFWSSSPRYTAFRALCGSSSMMILSSVVNRSAYRACPMSTICVLRSLWLVLKITGSDMFNRKWAASVFQCDMTWYENCEQKGNIQRSQQIQAFMLWSLLDADSTVDSPMANLRLVECSVVIACRHSRRIVSVESARVRVDSTHKTRQKPLIEGCSRHSFPAVRSAVSNVFLAIDQSSGSTLPG